MNRDNLEQRMDILEILEKQIVFLENQELSTALGRFRSENTQWVLNMIQDMLGQMQDALDSEDFSQNWS
jgi:uncharacterized protein YjgD (DUF1641 family)